MKNSVRLSNSHRFHPLESNSKWLSQVYHSFWLMNFIHFFRCWFFFCGFFVCFIWFVHFNTSATMYLFSMHSLMLWTKLFIYLFSRERFFSLTNWHKVDFCKRKLHHKNVSQPLRGKLIEMMSKSSLFILSLFKYWTWHWNRTLIAKKLPDK